MRVNAKLKEIVPGYLERRRADVEAISAALGTGDYASIGVLGHRMKGSGSGYGLNRITEIGDALEGAATAQNSELDRELNRGLADLLESLSIVYD